MGNRSLLQWICLTQESNPGLLHCRQVLYQLSYKPRVPSNSVQSVLWITSSTQAIEGDLSCMLLNRAPHDNGTFCFSRILPMETHFTCGSQPVVCETHSLYQLRSGSDGKVSVYNAGDLGLIPGLGRFPGEGNGSPLQYSWLHNPMDGGAWCRLLSMGSQRV